MELCSQGTHVEFMHTMYAPDIVSVEGAGKETAGKEPVVRKSEVFQGNNRHPQPRPPRAVLLPRRKT